MIRSAGGGGKIKVIRGLTLTGKEWDDRIREGKSDQRQMIGPDQRKMSDQILALRDQRVVRFRSEVIRYQKNWS